MKAIKLLTEIPGPAGQNLMDERKRYVPQGVSNMAPLVAKSAKGAVVEDVDGNRYLDFAGGIGTINVGHNAPEVVQAITKQANELIHTCFHVAAYEPYIELAKKLSQLAPGDTPKKTMFANSGAEAVENAVKIARKYTGKPAIIAFDYAFHGRTLMAMTLTSKVKPYKNGFGPFAPEVYKVPYAYCYRCAFGKEYPECKLECVKNFSNIFQKDIPAENVAAVIVEPVQGEGGFIAPPKEFLQGIKRICEENDILFIADEVQTGFGRTGKMFAIENFGIEADLITSAKSIAGGMPLSAVIGKEEIMDAPQAGEIGGTYGGNPISCAAGLKVIDIMEKEKLADRANHLGAIMKDRLEAMAEKCEIIGDVRGLGFMLAVELVKDRDSKEPAVEEKNKIARECYENGLLVMGAGLYNNVLRFLIPITITEEELAEGLDVLEEVIAKVNG